MPINSTEFDPASTDTDSEAPDTRETEASESPPAPPPQPEAAPPSQPVAAPPVTAPRHRPRGAGIQACVVPTGRRKAICGRIVSLAADDRDDNGGPEGDE